MAPEHVSTSPAAPWATGLERERTSSTVPFSGGSREEVATWPALGAAVDIEAGPVPVAVLGPGFRTAVVHLSLPVHIDENMLCHAVRAGLQTEELLPDSILLPASVQPAGSFLTFLQVPRWVAYSGQRVVVVDLSAFQEVVFAAFLPVVIEDPVLEQIADQYSLEPWVVYLDDDPERQSGALRVLSGSVLRFVPVDCVPTLAMDVVSVLSDEDFRPREISPLLLGACPPSWLTLDEHALSVVAHDSADPAALRGAILRRMHQAHDEVSFAEPCEGSLVASLLQGGRAVRGILGAIRASSDAQAGSATKVPVFVDARTLSSGLMVSGLLPGFQPVSAILDLLDIHLPQGFEVYVFGCDRGDSQVHVCAGAVFRVHARQQGGDSTLGQQANDLEDTLAVRFVTKTVHFAIFAPRCTPEVIGLDVDFPAGEGETGDLLSMARGLDAAVRFEFMTPARPQPQVGFGCILALPLWAESKVIALFDTRQIDGRLFPLVVDAWMQWGSFLLQTGLEGREPIDVYVRQRLASPGRPLVFESGDLITVLPPASSLPSLFDLPFKLNRAGLWDSELPRPVVDGRNTFLLLTDGLPRLAQIDRQLIRGTDDFRAMAAVALTCDIESLTCKVARPRISNCMHLGSPCEAVLLATVALRRTPVPPGRVFAPQVVVFFDLRAILQDFSWCILDSGLARLVELERRFEDRLPAGHQVCIHGGSQELQHGDTYLRCESCSILSVEYIPCTDRNPEGASESSEESSDDSSDSSDGPPDPAVGVPPPAEECDRSRTPRNRLPPQRGPRKLYLAHSVKPVAALLLSTGADACQTLSTRAPGDVAPGVLLGAPWCANTVLAAADIVGPVCCALDGNGVALLQASASLFAWLWAPRTQKWLVEPTPTTRAMQESLAALRYYAPLLGRGWRYTPARPFVTLRDVDPSESSDDAEEEAEAHFVVLVPGYLPESILTTLHLPATVHEVLSAVSHAREPAARDRFPLLAPASPQPRLGSGVVLAFAEWQMQDNLLCVDSSSLDGRIFSLSAPAYVTRQQLLALVNVSERIGVSVYVGVDDVPLADDVYFHTRLGLTVFIVPSDYTLPIAYPLEHVLAARFPWSSEPAFPERDAGQVYCLVHADCVVLFVLDPRRPTAYRRQIAACLGIPETRLQLVPAHRRVVDATLDGLLCRTVIAVHEERPGDARPPCLVLVDARALAAGWWSHFARGGQTSSAELLASVAEEAPVGWIRRLVGVQTEALFEVQPGQVFRLEVVRAYCPEIVYARMPVGCSDADALEAVNEFCLRFLFGSRMALWSSLMLPEHFTWSGLRSLPPGSALASAPRSMHLSHGDAILVVPTGQAAFATVTFSDMLRSTAGWLQDWAPDLTFEDTVWTLSEQEAFSFSVAAGRRVHFRSDIAVRLGVLPHSLILRAPDPMILDHEDRGVPSRNVIAAVTLPDAQDLGPAGPVCFLDLRPMLLRLSWQHFSEGRLPLTLLLSRFLARCPEGFALCRLDPIRGPSVVRQDIQVRHGEVVILTFLPIEVDSLEHSEGSGGSGPSLPSGRMSDDADANSHGTDEGAGSRATGSAGTSAGADAGGFYGTDPAEAAFSITRVTRVGHVRQILSPPLRFALFDDLLDACSTETRRGLRQLLDSQGPLPDKLFCFTDGSFSPPAPGYGVRCGWSCVLFHPASFTLSLIGGPLPEWVSRATPPSAFAAECTALIAALWVLPTIFWGYTIEVLSDCQAAIAIANGSRACSTAVGQALRHVASFAFAQLPGRLDIGYVQGHAGIFGNEVADQAAKSAAEGQSLGHLPWPSWPDLDCWSLGGKIWSWIGVACQWLAGDRALPDLLGGELCASRAIALEDRPTLLKPFLPITACDRSFDGTSKDAAQWVPFSIRLATYNALSLGGRHGASDVEACPAGLAHQPARPALLAASLLEAEIDVGAIQEARTPAGMVRTGGYLRLCSGACNGHLGVELWVRLGRKVMQGPSGSASEVELREEHFLVLHRDARLLITLCQCGFSVIFAVAHAPHRGTEHHLLEQWWSQTAGLLRKIVKGRPLVLAGDFNASVGTQVSCHISDLAAEEQDSAGEALHRILRDHELWIPATFEGVHTGSSWTFVQKRNQALIRPDMVAVPLAWRQARVASWTDPGVTAAHGVVDHVASVVSVRMRVCCSKLAPRSTARSSVPSSVSDPALQGAVSGVLDAAPRPAWDACSHSHAASVTGLLQAELRQVASNAPRRPTHPYLSASTWDLHAQVARLRRRCARIRQDSRFHLLFAAFRALREGRGDALLEMIEGPWSLSAHVAGTIASLQLRVLGRRLKTHCKNDRARYVEGLADAVERNQSGADTALQRLLCRRRKKAFAPAVLPEVLDDAGRPCDTPELVQRRWRDHFSAMENGVEVSVPDLTVSARVAQSALPMPVSIHDLPCLADLCQAFASTQAGKAGGPDGLPSALNAAFPRQLAHIWYPVLLKFCLLGEEPLGFKGGILTHLYKGRGSVSSCDSHRGILLLSVVAKALHRALRPAISRHFEAVAHPLQLGGRRGASVIFGSHLVRSFLRHRNTCKLSTVIVFSDVAAAYYRTERALTAQELNSQLPAIPAASTELDLEFQLAQPGALAQQGASSWLQAITHEIHSGTWMSLARDAQIVQTRRGTRPGSAWADLSFAVLAERILSVRDAQRSPITAASAGKAVPWDGARHWGDQAEPPTGPCGTRIDDIIWADDFAVCLGPSSALQVRPVLANETGALVDAFGSHGFELSFGERKTAALVSLRGAHAQRVKRDLFRGDATVPVLCEGRGTATLPLVPAYRHLGVTIDPSGNIAVELKLRCQHAWVAFREHRTKLFRCKRISVVRRGSLLGTFVLTRLTFGAGAWPPLRACESRIFSRTLFALYRATLAVPRDSDQHLSTVEVCSLVGQPDADTVLHVERLRYLRQLVAGAPDQLWALVRLDLPYLRALRESLAWLYSWVHRTTDLPCPLADPEPWTSLMCRAPGRFKGLVRRAKGLALLRASGFAVLRALLRSLQALEGAPIAPAATSDGVFTDACLICGLAFTSRAAWACHASKKHGYRLVTSQMAGTSDRLCLGCGKCFAKPARLRRHLLNSVQCRKSWGSFQPSSASLPVMHAMALPVSVPGVLSGAPAAAVDPASFHRGLLGALRALDRVDCDTAWCIVKDFVEPLSVLRATVGMWAAEAGATPEVAEAAADIQLMLDPQLCCDEFRTSRALGESAAVFAGLEWHPPCPFPFVLSGEVAVFRLEEPPLNGYVYPFTQSLPLGAASRFIRWFEVCCDVLGAFAQTSAVHPVSLCASTVALDALEPERIQAPLKDRELGVRWKTSGDLVIRTGGLDDLLLNRSWDLCCIDPEALEIQKQDDWCMNVYADSGLSGEPIARWEKGRLIVTQMFDDTTGIATVLVPPTEPGGDAATGYVKYSMRDGRPLLKAMVAPVEDPPELVEGQLMPGAKPPDDEFLEGPFFAVLPLGKEELLVTVGQDVGSDSWARLPRGYRLRCFAEILGFRARLPDLEGGGWVSLCTPQGFPHFRKQPSMAPEIELPEEVGSSKSSARRKGATIPIVWPGIGVLWPEPVPVPVPKPQPKTLPELLSSMVSGRALCDWQRMALPPYQEMVWKNRHAPSITRLHELLRLKIWKPAVVEAEYAHIREAEDERSRRIVSMPLGSLVITQWVSPGGSVRVVVATEEDDPSPGLGWTDLGGADGAALTLLTEGTDFWVEPQGGHIAEEDQQDESEWHPAKMQLRETKDPDSQVVGNLQRGDVVQIAEIDGRLGRVVRIKAIEETDSEAVGGWMDLYTEAGWSCLRKRFLGQVHPEEVRRLDQRQKASKVEEQLSKETISRPSKVPVAEDEEEDELAELPALLKELGELEAKSIYTRDWREAIDPVWGRRYFVNRWSGQVIHHLVRYGVAEAAVKLTIHFTNLSLHSDGLAREEFPERKIASLERSAVSGFAAIADVPDKRVQVKFYDGPAQEPPSSQPSSPASEDSITGQTTKSPEADFRAVVLLKAPGVKAAWASATLQKLMANAERFGQLMAEVLGSVPQMWLLLIKEDEPFSMIRADLEETDIPRDSEIVERARSKASELSELPQPIDTEFIELRKNLMWSRPRSMRYTFHHIGEVNARAIGEGLEMAFQAPHAQIDPPHLEELSIWGCGIGNGGAVAFANAFALGCGRKLQTIILDDNDIGAAGATALGAGLQNCPELRELSLPKNPLGKGFSSLLSGLGETLKVLDASEASLDDAAAQAIAAAVPRFPLLRSLRLAGNVALSLLGVEAVVRSMLHAGAP
ncbi:unnamed protein product [Symbiodinium sp. CCMP2592]|nr:unnamed protein product [Symbiodinium sp. CCMP2592]